MLFMSTTTPTPICKHDYRSMYLIWGAITRNINLTSEQSCCWKVSLLSYTGPYIKVTVQVRHLCLRRVDAAAIGVLTLKWPGGPMGQYHSFFAYFTIAPNFLLVLYCDCHWQPHGYASFDRKKNQISPVVFSLITIT